MVIKVGEEVGEGGGGRRRVGVGLTYRGLSISAFLKHCPREYHIWKVAAQQSMAGYFGMQKQPIRKAECTESMLTKKKNRKKEAIRHEA